MFQLKSEADELRQKYLKKYSNAVEAAVGAVVPISAQVESLRDGFKCKVSSKSSEVKIIAIRVEGLVSDYGRRLVFRRS